MLTTWNCKRKPPAIGYQVFVLGAPGIQGVHPGEVVRHQTVQIRGMKSLGADYKAVVRLVDGREVTPAIICLESDHQGRMELHRVFLDLPDGQK